MAKRKPRTRKPQHRKVETDIQLCEYLKGAIKTDTELERDYGGRPTKYDVFYHPKTAKFLIANFGAKDNQICDFFKINKTTLYVWREKYERFNNSIIKGRDIWNVGTAENALYKKVCGYNYTTRKYRRMIVRDGNDKPILDKQGRKQYEMVLESVMESHVPPDTQAINMLLVNRSRDRWTGVTHNINGKIDHEHKHRHQLEASQHLQEQLGGLSDEALQGLLELKALDNVEEADWEPGKEGEDE